MLPAACCLDVCCQDFYQLLQPNISMLRYPSGPLYTQRTFSEEFGLPEGSTNLWVDVKALAGDASDNIPGIRGVGLKTALQLVQQLGGVDNILHSFAAGQQPQQVRGVGACLINIVWPEHMDTSAGKCARRVPGRTVIWQMQCLLCSLHTALIVLDDTGSAMC